MNKIVMALCDYEEVKKGDKIEVRFEGDYLYGGYRVNCKKQKIVKIPKSLCQEVSDN